MYLYPLSYLLSALALAEALPQHIQDSSNNTVVAAGYHVIWSYAGPTIPQSIFTAAQAGQVGGLILFGENVSNTTASQLAALQATYKNSTSYIGYPLLIVTDQEGGEVARLPGGPYLSAKQVGLSSDPAQSAAQSGTTMAQGFANYNVNGNLAPVCGVFRTPGDFLDQYQRSYGNTSAIVSECVGPMIDSLQAAGYVATAKHFPGLGAALADQDTDVSPVTINLTLSTLQQVDEVPFRTAIAHGVKAVMPSWALYPALDPTYPSGLSEKWIGSELRERLGFTGVTLSDAIEAGALEAFGNSGDRAVMAMNAGMDMILCAARNTTQGPQVIQYLTSAVSSGKISQDTFAASTQRVLNLRQWIAENTASNPSPSR